MSRDVNIPLVIKAVAWTSFFINVSSVIIFSYFSIYLKDVLHVDFAQLGFINGVIDATSYVMKVFSGYISDFIGSRKILLLIGCILLFISKLLQPTCTKALQLFGARTFETFAHGLQGTPINALVCDWSDNHSRNICFGLRYSIGSLGSILGALLESFLFYYFRDFQTVFFFSCIPSAMAIFIVIFFVKDNKLLSNNSYLTPPQY